ncbi:MAG: NAD(P)-binding protein [Nitrospirae bacterium]|nr:NAD(P)-binding protein [Nitrospirota bacterium]
MKVGTSYKHKEISGDYDAIVIGSGMGGLATAAWLAKHGGKRVLVLERHYTAGGFTHTFRRPGYEWDIGVHYIGQVMDLDSPVRQAFDDLTGAELDWADMGEVYDKVLIGDDSYDFVKGREEWRSRMHEYFPAERQAIDRYLDLLRSTFRRTGLFFAEKAMPEPMARVAGGLMRWPLMRRARKNTRETLEELTRDQRLIGVLTAQWGDYGLPPSQSSFFIHALVAGHYLKGGAYPVGGSSRIAATIEPVIEAAGGAVVTSAEVSEIVVEEGRAVGVRMADGNELRAPAVISNAGFSNTFSRLLPAAVVSSLGFEEVAERFEPSTAHLSLYIGLQETAADLDLKKTNLWIYPDHDHDRNVERFLDDPSAPLPLAYISFPSAKDPDFERRCPGRATIEVVTMVPYEWFRKWEDKPWMKRGEEYVELKEKLTERLLEPLYEHCPQVQGKVDHAELSTPLSTRHFTGYAQGEIYGLTATPERFAERRLKPRTPVPGLYLTGSDASTAGVAGALYGGLFAASAVLRRDLRGDVAKGAEAARSAG